MKRLNKISVIVPTHNSVNTLIECIKSVSKQTLKPYEIIVVDNASTDKTKDMVNNLTKKIKRLRYFRNNKNFGVAGGRNRGIREASKVSDYLFFFDHDMVADPKMLEELVSVAKIKENIGVVTPKIYYWGIKNVIWSAGTDVNLWTGQTIFYGGKDKGQYNKVRVVGVAPAAFLVKRIVVDKIGGFDTTYFATYEDTDFCYRAKSVGFLTYYAPKAIAYHKIPYDSNDANIRLLGRTYWIARNRIIFMKKFGRNYLLFLIIYPIFFPYYFYLSLKYRKFKPIIDYISGAFAGLFTK